MFAFCPGISRQRCGLNQLDNQMTIKSDENSDDFDFTLVASHQESNFVRTAELRYRDGDLS